MADLEDRMSLGIQDNDENFEAESFHEENDAIMRDSNSTNISSEELANFAYSPWERFLEFTVDRIRRLILGDYVSTDASSMLSEEDFSQIHEWLLEPDRPVDNKELILFVNQTRLETLPMDFLFEILDRLFNFHQDDEERLEIGFIHTLHGLRLLSDYTRVVVNDWMLRSRPKWEKFGSHELWCYPTRDAVKEAPSTPWSYHYLPFRGIEEENVAVQAAITCVECFRLLVEQNLIPIGGYDLNGESFLNWVIRKRCQPVVDYMIDVMPVEEFFYSTAPRLGYRDDKHPLVSLLESGNQKGFEKLLGKLAESRGLENWDLGWSLKDDQRKLQMCAFLSAQHADLLLKKFNINIGEVVMKKEINWEYPLGRVGAYLPYRPTTSSWHQAARHNPDGEAFMEWLSENSGSKSTTLNKQGYTSIIRYSYALRAAAFNQTFHSNEMFKMILNGMPDAFFRDFALVSEVFGWIIDGLVVFPV
ncbi:hypothetical protein N7520_010812 [Penicillium odoratum]|uniref:uncharacterized protein n=1 Tax=Penicillium odoratum TaxID=1167516 RepID=UPI002547C644|nr:uncharacterized protein N7520_010812 [Penicillium odoratum]KAJ5745630.1 hypothetical protein N7520_010812 [Penicillium odoratum]